MKIYLGGDPQYSKVSKFIVSPYIPSIFQSYYYCNNGASYQKLVNLGELKIKGKMNLFLDSGAFSSWRKGEQINIKKYTQFIKENQKYLSHYASLDVIGNPEKTWENQKIMEDAGLNPIPCFHYGEDIKYLTKYYLSGKYKYIALGGMVGNFPLSKWLDNLFVNYLCDEQGTPIVKVHGFGLTRPSLVIRYPWYSIDSSSWVRTGSGGAVLVPRCRNGKWTYKIAPFKIYVSSRSPKKETKKSHFDVLPIKERNQILEYFINKGYKFGKTQNKNVEGGYSLKENEKWIDKKKTKVEIILEGGVSNDYKLRDELNIIYFLDLEKRLPAWPWQFKIKRKGLKI